MFSNADKRRIEQADAKRRQERELDELMQLTSRGSKGRVYNDRPDAYINPELIKGIGMVSPPLKARYSERWLSSTGTNKPRCVGTVNDLPTPSVRVIHADSSTEIRPVSSFSKSRGGRSQKAPQAIERTHRITAADLAPIGDANH